jgi:dTDP-4-amino-4,6-dideoxygalactose transaminase
MVAKGLIRQILTDIQAALGLSQIAGLNSYIAQRHQLAARYDEAFRDLPLTRPWQHPDSFSSYHLYPIRIPKSDKGKTQRQIYDALIADGFNVNVNVHDIPVYRQPYYESMGLKSGYCPATESYCTETISIPMFPSLTKVMV